MKLAKVMGAGLDVPFSEAVNQASAAAGTGSDYEGTILVVPDLTKLNIPTGASGDLPTNSLYLRSLLITPAAAVTGAATNNYLWGFKQYRGGTIVNQVNTQHTGAITAGSGVVVTPVTGTLMTGIQVGSVLHIAAGGGTAEDVIVTAVSYTAGTFTATFAFNHNANTAVTGVYLAAVWYNGSGVTESAFTTHQLTPLPNAFKPGDVLTFARVSYGTGLSGGSPAVTATAEWTMLAGSSAYPMPRG